MKYGDASAARTRSNPAYLRIVWISLALQQTWAARARPGRLGTVTLLYGHMQIGDLVRTSTSPIPDPGVIEYQTQLVGLGWAATIGQATIGATGARHTTTLDARAEGRLTIDIGASVPIGSRVRVAGATHFFSHLDTGDPAQDLYLGAEALAWRGQPWDVAPETAFYARYGTAVAHGFTADQHIGAGFAFGGLVTVDLLASYEGGYAAGGWQPVAGGVQGCRLWRRGGGQSRRGGARPGIPGQPGREVPP